MLEQEPVEMQTPFCLLSTAHSVVPGAARLGERKRRRAMRGGDGMWTILKTAFEFEEDD